MWKRSQWKRGSVFLPESRTTVRGLRPPNLSTDALSDQLVQVTPILEGSTLAIWIGEQESDDRVLLGAGVYALTTELCLSPTRFRADSAIAEGHTPPAVGVE